MCLCRKNNYCVNKYVADAVHKVVQIWHANRKGKFE